MSVTDDTNVRPAVHQLGAPAAAYESAVWGERFWSGTRLVADVVLLALAGAIAAFSWPECRIGARVLWPVLFGVIVVCMSLARGTYRRRTKLDSLEDLRSTGWVVAVATSAVVTLQRPRRRQRGRQPHRPVRAPGRAPRRRRPRRPQFLAAADEASGQSARADPDRRRRDTSGARRPSVCSSIRSSVSAPSDSSTRSRSTRAQRAPPARPRRELGSRQHRLPSTGSGR